MEEYTILYKKETTDKVDIIAMSNKSSCKCPSCGVTSTAKHSRYTRKIIDGSFDGIPREVLLIVRKFKCNNSGCSQKIFTERLDFVSPYGRKSNKLIEFITLLALITSAEKVSKIMSKLGVKLSNHTVLRIINKLPQSPVLNSKDIINIGIDDFALKKGNLYGTIICNLDTKQIIDVLPSRTKEELSKWLQQYPNIRVVSRDGSQSYAAAITETVPRAIQVSDKFHLIKNLLEAVGSYIKRSYPINLPIYDNATIDENNVNNNIKELCSDTSTRKTTYEILRQQKIESKQRLINEIKSRHREGTSIMQLSKEYSMSRNTIKKYIKMDEFVYYAKRIKHGSQLDQYKNLITDLVKQCKSHQYILKVLKDKGYDGSRSSLSGYMSRNNIKKETVNGKIELKPNNQTINRNYLIKCICKNTDNLTESETESLRKIWSKYSEIKELNVLINDFKNLFEECNNLNLEGWITRAKSFKIQELDSYINGISKDIEAVKNSINSRYTNGLLEGIVNKVKVIKRISYGRCSFSLLRTKILYA